MKKLLLSLLASLTLVGAANAGSVIINNESWHIVEIYIRYHKDDIMHIRTRGPGELENFNFGTDIASVSYRQIGHDPQWYHMELGVNDHKRVDLAGTWFDSLKRNVYDVPPNTHPKFEGYPEFGGI